MSKIHDLLQDNASQVKEKMKVTLYATANSLQAAGQSVKKDTDLRISSHDADTR